MEQRWLHSGRRGRSSTPAEVVRSSTYATLEWEVRGSLVYRRFCRIDGGKVPDEKTMVRYGQLLGAPVLQRLFERIVRVSAETGVTRGRRMRIDTTVVERRSTTRPTATSAPTWSAYCPARSASSRRPAPSSLSCGSTCVAASRVASARARRRAPHRSLRPRSGPCSDRQRWFRRGRAWRAGGEARISHLKNRCGMARSRYRGSGGTARTVYWAAIANNLAAIGRAV